MIDALEGFVSTGLRAGEGVAVIGTATHVHELEKRLRAHWLDIDRARWEGRYVPMLAQETLTRFMRGICQWRTPLAKTNCRVKPTFNLPA